MRALIALAALWACIIAPQRAFCQPRQPPSHPTLRDALAASLTHSRGLGPDVAAATRYISLHPLPATDWSDAAKTLAFHFNSFSKSRDLYFPERVTPYLLAINLDALTIKRTTFGRLTDVDPYVHYAGGDPKWLDAGQLAELKARVQSQTPLLMGDWLFVQTAIQADRNGTGYYDFLGVGDTLADFDKLLGFDRKAPIQEHLEQLAILHRSGVTLQNRVIARNSGPAGDVWTTYDARKSLAKSNALRQLGKEGTAGGFEPDASELYGRLANGLYAYFLADGKGKRVDTAPDFIASDKQATGNDARVHVAKSCIGCHVEGLRPFDDYMRRVYRQDTNPLYTPDAKEALRLKDLYFSDLKEKYDDDVSRYARAVKKLTGRTPATQARLYAALWDNYQEVDHDVDAIARRVGLPPAEMLRRLRAYADATKGLDPVIAGLLVDPPEAIRAEHLEEVYPALMQILGYP